MKFRIIPARTDSDLADVRALFCAYEASLGIDLSYQDFAAELRDLPGKYAPPLGEILLARDHRGTPVGCVAMRPLESNGRCEMKRLFVAEPARGSGLGKTLVQSIIEAARNAGYREMWLDSLPTMQPAQGLYRSVGFESAEPYYDTPIPTTVFMKLTLR